MNAIPSGNSYSQVSSLKTESAYSPGGGLEAEQSQLDEILNELLGDPMLISSTSPPPQQQQQQQQSPGSSSTSEITRALSPGGGKIVTTTRTYSTAPGVQTTETIKEYNNKFSYSQPAVSVEKNITHNVTSSHTTSTSENAKSAPRNIRTSPSPSVEEMQSKGMIETQQRVGSPFGRSPSPSMGSPTMSRLHSVPYKIDYDITDVAPDNLSWLQQQQYKLRNKKEGPNWQQRTKQERRLVEELKSAQSRFMSKRAQSSAEEQAVVESYARTEATPNFQTNGPHLLPVSTPSPEKEKPRSFSPLQQREPSPVVQRAMSPPQIQHKVHRSPERITSPERFASPPRLVSPPPRTKSPAMHMHTVMINQPQVVNRDNYKTEASYFVSGIERPPFTTHQTKYTFCVSPPVDARMKPTDIFTTNAYISAKPPPSPGPGRSSAPNSPLIPQRGSSRDVMSRNRTTSTTQREWSSHGRVLQRQRSDTTYDRDPPIIVQRTEATNGHVTPVERPVSPVTSSYQYQFQQSEIPVQDVMTKASYEQANAGRSKFKVILTLMLLVTSLSKTK